MFLNSELSYKKDFSFNSFITFSKGRQFWTKSIQAEFIHPIPSEFSLMYCILKGLSWLGLVSLNETIINIIFDAAKAMV